MQLLQGDQPMPVWTQGEQQKTELLQGEAGEGKGASPPLKLDLSLSQRENQVKEGEGKRLLPDLDHPPSCNNSTEIPHVQRECRGREGEGTRLLLNLHHHPGSSSSQEIPAHHPWGQLA